MHCRLPPIGRRLSARAVLPVVLVAAGIHACSDVSPTATNLDHAFAPGGGGPPVKVTATDPAEAEQGTTLTVRVLGSNFEPGAVAEFMLEGVPSGKVRTNSTTFVSPDELLADITIDAGADLGLYDVEVTTPRGKKGVGTELFLVTLPGANGTGIVSLSVSLRDGVADGITSDGGGAYADGDGGVSARLERQFSLGTTGSTPSPPTPRHICFDFGAQSADWFETTGPICGTAIWNTSLHDNDPGGMKELPPGTTMRAFSRFIYRDPVDDKQVWVQFGDVDDPGLSSPNRAVIRRLDLLTWEIEATSQLARVMKEGKKVRGQIQRDTLGFVPMPFKAVLRAR